jgi:Uma2 family endonuclease
MGALERDDYYYNEEDDKLTVDEFLEYIDTQDNNLYRYELCDGYIVMMAGNTSFLHQNICSYLARKIGNYLEGKPCTVVQDTYIFLSANKSKNSENIFQPDVMVCCDKSKETRHGYEGAPEFIIEVISKSTSRYDYVVKKQKYMLYGVKEYWIVDIFKKQIIVHINTGSNTLKIKKLSFNDVIPVSIFEGLSIDFNEVKKLVNEDKNFANTFN